VRGIDIHLQRPQIEKRGPGIWQCPLGIKTLVVLRTRFILAINETDEPWRRLGDVTPRTEGRLALFKRLEDTQHLFDGLRKATRGILRRSG
jgi:hypothetical protein